MTRHDDLLEWLAQLNPVPHPSRLYEDIETSPQSRLDYEKRRDETMAGIKMAHPHTGRRGRRVRRGLLIAATAAALVILVGLTLTFVTDDRRDVANRGSPTLRLAFDGEECLYEGPAALSPGAVEIEFSNRSAERAWMDFARLDEDKTVEDVQAYLASGQMGSPSWAHSAWSPTLAARSSTTQNVVLEPGLHVLVCGTWTPYAGHFGAGLPVE